MRMYGGAARLKALQFIEQILISKWSVRYTDVMAGLLYVANASEKNVEEKRTILRLENGKDYIQKKNENPLNSSSTDSF